MVSWYPAGLSLACPKWFQQIPQLMRQTFENFQEHMLGVYAVKTVSTPALGVPFQSLCTSSSSPGGPRTTFMGLNATYWYWHLRKCAECQASYTLSVTSRLLSWDPPTPSRQVSKLKKNISVLQERSV